MMPRVPRSDTLLRRRRRFLAAAVAGYAVGVAAILYALQHSDWEQPYHTSALSDASRVKELTFEETQGSRETQEPPETPTPPKGSKRRSAETPVSRAEKKSRLSGPAALESLAHSMDTFGNSTRTALVPPESEPDTPRRRQLALKRAQDLEKCWLTRKQLLSLVHLFQKDNNAVETYLVLEDELRKDWVCDQLGVEHPIPWSNSD